MSLTSSSIQAIEFNSSFGMSCMSSNNNSQKKKPVNPLKWMESSPAYICIIDLASFDSLLSALELSKSGLAIMCKFQSISASYINQMKQNRVAPLRPLTDFHGQNERSRPHPVRPLQKPLTGKVRCGEFSMVSPKRCNFM